MIYNFKLLIVRFIVGISFCFPVGAFGATTVNVDASKLVSTVNVFLTPRSGSFVEGSSFEVPILLDTKENNINGVEVKINFDKDKLTIVHPSGGKSIIGVWIEPPKYDNNRGTASYVGVIPDGIKTNSGLIGTITFKAKKTGVAIVSVSSDSKILLNDGLGTEALLDNGRAEYNILPKAPEGLVVFSSTHPIQSSWYNNKNPVISWESAVGVEGFSFELDDKPSTIPDNKIDSIDTSKSFENLDDGLRYFHIKARKNGVWGNTSNFLLRIDSTPPADFKPETNYIVAASVMLERTLVSFFTTDNLSGVDYYEVGVIDKKQPTVESPVFVEAESPFQVPLTKDGSLEVIVRAVDRAGNVRDSSIGVKAPFVIAKFFEDNLIYILVLIILVGLALAVSHYLLGHHIIGYLRRVFVIAKQEEKKVNEKLLPYDTKPENSIQNDNDKFDGGTI